MFLFLIIMLWQKLSVFLKVFTLLNLHVLFLVSHAPLRPSLCTDVSTVSSTSILTAGVSLPNFSKIFFLYIAFPKSHVGTYVLGTWLSLLTAPINSNSQTISTRSSNFHYKSTTKNSPKLCLKFFSSCFYIYFIKNVSYNHNNNCIFGIHNWGE